MSEAWAVGDLKGIMIDTISSTRRAAIVNFLVRERQLLILNSHTDDEIERMWKNCSRHVHVCRVRVEPLL